MSMFFNTLDDLIVWVIMDACYPKHARISMNNLMEHAENKWTLLLNDHFQDYDDFAQSIRGWGVDFRQLKPGRSPASLQQFGVPDLLVTRFNMSQAYDQRGSTPNKMLTIGFLEEAAGMAQTPEGIISVENVWCFSSGREFECTNQADFRAFGLSVSEALIDEVADTCELRDIHSSLGSNQVVRCRQRADLDRIRQQLATISRILRNSSNDQPTMLAPKHDLVRELLEILAGPQEITSLKMTTRKQLVLRRALDFLDANPGSPITVHQLAKETGAGIRTLEYVFRDYYGVTPKAYLSARRLSGARRELQWQEIESTLVSDVAHRWGFWHLGRFSADYKRFFGELPSETLDKNRHM